MPLADPQPILLALVPLTQLRGQAPTPIHIHLPPLKPIPTADPTSALQTLLNPTHSVE